MHGPAIRKTFFTLNGLPGNLKPKDPKLPFPDTYPGSTDRKDPVLSPLYADLHGMPPSLLVSSTRDLLLSNTTIFHRALLNAGLMPSWWCTRRCRTHSGITSNYRRRGRRSR